MDSWGDGERERDRVKGNKTLSITIHFSSKYRTPFTFGENIPMYNVASY